MQTDEVINLSAVVVIEALKKGELDLLEYVDALLTRCEEFNFLNAFVTLEADKLRESSKHKDKLKGPLYGLPLIIKDNIDVAGMPTTACTPALSNWVPENNATITQSLIDASAQVMGKASMHELAYGITSDNAYYGNVCNPYDLDCIPGGSSSGTAAAIVARLVPAGLGSDTGGSCRMPASLCGCVGFRPSTGRYSNQGVICLSWTRDTAGILARTVDDIALLDRVCSKDNVAPPEFVDLQGLRLGIPRTGFYDDLDTETAKVISNALKTLTDAGATLIEADIDNIFELEMASSFPAILFESVRELSVYLGKNASKITVSEIIAEISDPAIKQMFAQQYSEEAVTSDMYFGGIVENRPKLQQAYSNYFKENKLDAIVVPTTPIPARSRLLSDVNKSVELNGREVDTFLTYIRNVSAASNVGLPALSIPAGLTGAGLPVGIEFVGERSQDMKLLSIGKAFESCRPDLPAPTMKST